MQVNLRVRRFNPDADREARYQDYQVEAPDSATVLDTLIQVREEVDETLGLRCSCRSSICGSCNMRINGVPRLACKTKLSNVAAPDGAVTVEPMGNMPVLKDLIVDFEVFWNKVKAIKPWLRTEGPEPEREYIVPNDRMLHLIQPVACIMCGGCVAACPELEVNPNFLGPAALAKAYRFVADPRDAHTADRLQQYSDADGIWNCAHTFFCVEVCPKGVAPMDWILALRREAEKAGYTDNNGVRHSRVFAESVRESGWLDEAKLAMDSMGSLKEKMALVSTGVRSFFRGKMPPTGPFHYHRPGSEHVTRIFQEIESEEPPRPSGEG